MSAECSCLLSCSLRAIMKDPILRGGVAETSLGTKPFMLAVSHRSLRVSGVSLWGCIIGSRQLNSYKHFWSTAFAGLLCHVFLSS
jgi:hypothetical protein